MRMVGVDIGGSHITVALFSGTTIEKREYLPYAPRADAPELIETIIKAVSNVTGSYGEIPVGVGMAGIILNTGLVVSSPNLCLTDVPVQQMLRDAGLRAHVLNDANAAALAEWYSGAGRGLSTIVCVTVGTGIGSGVVIEGKLISGFGGRAGEIGHMIMQPGGPACKCGNHGCLEALSSATAIVRDGLAACESDEILAAFMSKGAESRGARAVFTAAEQGSKLARQIIDEAGMWLGRGLCNVVSVIDPEMVVVGGGVALAGEMLLVPVRRAMHDNFLGRMKHTPVVAAVHGTDAGVIGAAVYGAQAEGILGRCTDD